MFPEMSQAPAPSDLSRTTAGKGNSTVEGKLGISYVEGMLGQSSQHQASGQGVFRDDHSRHGE